MRLAIPRRWVAEGDWACAAAELRWRGQPQRPDETRHLLFARAVAHDAAGITAAEAVEAATGLDPWCDENRAVSSWLQQAALVFYTRHISQELVTMFDRYAGRPRRRQRPQLVCEPAVRGRLPLLALARDAARYQPGHRLVVVVLDQTVAGWYRRGDTAGVIGLGSHVVGADATLRDAFVHELAHATDPAWPDSTVAEAERYVELLAPLLLEHHPTTVVAARQLVAPAQRAAGEPSDLELLFSFFSLDLNTERITMPPLQNPPTPGPDPEVVDGEQPVPPSPETISAEPPVTLPARRQQS